MQALAMMVRMTEFTLMAVGVWSFLVSSRGMT